MHPEQNRKNEELPKGAFVGILFIWALTILILQFTVWVTLTFLDFGTSWKECGLIAALWVFVIAWVSGLRTRKN